MPGKMNWNRVRIEKREVDARAKGFKVAVDDVRFDPPPSTKRTVVQNDAAPELVSYQDQDERGLRLRIQLRGNLAASILARAMKENIDAAVIVERALRFYLAPQPLRQK